MTIRAFSLLYLGLRLAVINECEDEISVLQLCRRTFHLTGAARLLLVDQSPGVARPPHEVEQHRQVGEGGRQQGLRVEELDGQVESSVPADGDHQPQLSNSEGYKTHFHWVSMLSYIFL